VILSSETTHLNNVVFDVLAKYRILSVDAHDKSWYTHNGKDYSYKCLTSFGVKEECMSRPAYATSIIAAIYAYQHTLYNYLHELIDDEAAAGKHTLVWHKRPEIIEYRASIEDEPINLYCVTSRLTVIEN
jgi:hypothetical protein